MRIAIFTETYLPYINGVVTHIKILRDGLVALGHEVLIVTADTTTRHHYLKDGVLYCPAKRIKLLYGYGLASPYSHRRTAYVREFNPDIIHVHQEFGVGVSGFHVAKRLHKPLVYTLHTMYDDYIYYVALRPFAPLIKKISHLYFRELSRRADEITGPSKKVEEYLNSIHVRKLVNVVPNSVETDTFAPERIDPAKTAALRAKLGIAPEKTVGIFVGRLGKEKSVDLLLDYIKETVTPDDNLEFVIIGDGPCYDELREQAKALGIADIVHFTGKIAHEETFDYYAMSDFYITASLSDTMSISMLEGMSTGLPTLVRADPLNAGQVVDGENGYSFESAEQMHALIKKLETMPDEELAALKHGARAFVKSLGATNLANRLLEVYEKALKRGSRVPVRRRAAAQPQEHGGEQTPKE